MIHFYLIKRIESNNLKLKQTSNEKKIGSNSFNFIDELQYQIKNGGINFKNFKSEISKPKATIILDNNNNDTFDINENRKSFEPPNEPIRSNENNFLIKKISDQQPIESCLNNNILVQPEWKRLLIEKKKQQKKINL